MSKRHLPSKPTARLSVSPDRFSGQILRFASVGVVNTLADFSLFSAMTFLLNLNMILANAISYSAGILVSYLLNSRFTFSGPARSNRRIMLFILVNIASLAISSAMLFAVHSFAPMSVAKIIATLTAFSFNFIFCRRVLSVSNATAELMGRIERTL